VLIPFPLFPCAALLLFASFHGAGLAPRDAHAADPPRAPRALIVSVDGLRPDVALRADMPVLRGLMARGSFTMWANTTDLAVTLPSHASMLTGVTPAKHRITYNSDPKPGQPAAPDRPTLLEIANRAGRTTAMVAGKSKFSIFAGPAAADRASVPARGVQFSDAQVADTAAAWIRRYRPQVMFVHLPQLDEAGHQHGWGSVEQVRQAGATDRQLGRILQALSLAGLADSTLVILSSDHGGAGTTHGGTDARSRHIPWIAAGPGVRRGYDLTQIATLQVNTEDTFATVCAWLGLPSGNDPDGHAVLAIGERSPAVAPAPAMTDH
jgi:predicted AlkP superfamily pyrophosphatase or phosphodiesterase